MFFSSGLYSLSLTYESQVVPLCFTHHATKGLLISRLSMGKAGAPRAWPNAIPFGLIKLICWQTPPWVKTLFSKLCFPICFPSQGPAVPRSPLCPCRLGLAQCGCTVPYRDTVWVTEAQYFVSMLKCFKESKENMKNCCMSQNFKKLILKYESLACFKGGKNPCFQQKVNLVSWKSVIKNTISRQ